MEFKTGNAITNIPKRCCAVTDNRFGFAFDVFKQKNTVRADDLGVFAIKTKEEQRAVFDLVKRFPGGLFE